MHSLLKAAPASAALAAILAMCPLSLAAQEAASNDAGPPGATADPPAIDEIPPPFAQPADLGEIGDALPDDTMSAGEGFATERATLGSELPAEEEFPEDEGDDDTADVASEGSNNRDRLAATLAASEEAAVAVREAAQRLPSILDRIDALVIKIERLPVEKLVTELTSLATSANTLVSSEATQALPADLSATLTEVEALLRDIREGGVIDNANLTLQSTRAAADTLPSLAGRAGVLLDQAGVTIQGFQGSDRILREAERTLGEVADAAEAVARLARTLERNPNSVLFGR